MSETPNAWAGLDIPESAWQAFACDFDAHEDVDSAFRAMLPAGLADAVLRHAVRGMQAEDVEALLMRLRNAGDREGDQAALLAAFGLREAAP